MLSNRPFARLPRQAATRQGRRVKAERRDAGTLRGSPCQAASRLLHFVPALRDTASPAAQTMTTGTSESTDGFSTTGTPPCSRLTRRDPEGGFVHRGHPIHRSAPYSGPRAVQRIRTTSNLGSARFSGVAVWTLARCRDAAPERPSSGRGRRTSRPGTPPSARRRATTSGPAPGVLASTTSLRMTAVSATFGGLPRVVSSVLARQNCAGSR